MIQGATRAKKKNTVDGLEGGLGGLFNTDD